LLKYHNKLTYGGVKAVRKLASLFVLLVLAIPCGARTITVDDDGPADFNNIQAGIDDANDGDVVVVAPGTYTGPGNRDIDFLGKAITVRSTDPNDPNIVASTIIDCNGTETEPHRGFKFHNGEDANSVLAGLTIINGYAPEEFVWDLWISFGGAIFCYDAGPTITKCTISRNKAHSDDDSYHLGGGGGICCLGENLTMTITDCYINENTAVAYGGGILCEPSTLHGYCVVTTSNCTITKNSACVGGGICSRNGTTMITDCTIQDNSASVDGGGVYAGWETITNCSITGNTAGRDGGGINSGSPTITNCIISGNSVGRFGGGVFL
jgi:hypothetical protein